ncbi:hypothetical protein KUC_2804 [Vreelandella boliviensis LC1]|uniref:Uncharacterized protein n=1 Tax=Vreelandella boliviensis LC1 TaxID=1072583 RepID=A0A7U9C453_9GAMM|nr:hypothetical protein KUC_2804 [Halomonas boliviensis LC1]
MPVVIQANTSNCLSVKRAKRSLVEEGLTADGTEEARGAGRRITSGGK